MKKFLVMEKKQRAIRDIHTGIFSAEKLDGGTRARRREMRSGELFRPHYLPRPPRPVPPPYPHDRSYAEIAGFRTLHRRHLFLSISLSVTLGCSLSLFPWSIQECRSLSQPPARNSAEGMIRIETNMEDPIWEIRVRARASIQNWGFFISMLYFISFPFFVSVKINK